jgi:tetratricopeptide (TPR) repeat protein
MPPGQPLAPSVWGLPRSPRPVLDASGAVDSPPVQAQLLATLAMLFTMQQRAADADEALARGRAIVEHVGHIVWLFSIWTGYVHLWQNDGAGAERELLPGYGALKKLGEKTHHSSICYALARAYYAQGRLDETEQLTRECQEACRQNDVHAHIMWRSTRAKVLARRGDIEAALRFAREAVEFASTSDFLMAHGDALLDLAEVLELSGDRHGAEKAIDEAIRVHELKGNLVGIELARERRVRLGTSTGEPGGSPAIRS